LEHVQYQRPPGLEGERGDSAPMDAFWTPKSMTDEATPDVHREEEGAEATSVVA